MRNYYKLIIFILIIFLSVGFAYLTANLDITGSITFKDNVWDVHLENVVVEANSIDAPLPNIEENNINFSISMNRPGDYYEFYVDLVNAGTMDATLDTITKTPLTGDYATYLNYNLTYYDGNEVIEGNILRASLKQRIKIRVEYKYDLNNYKKLNNIDLNITFKYIKIDNKNTSYDKTKWEFAYISEENNLEVCKESIDEEDETHIKTRSTTNVSETPTSNYAKIGNGYARITYIG